MAKKSPSWLGVLIYGSLVGGSIIGAIFRSYSPFLGNVFWILTLVVLGCWLTPKYSLDFKKNFWLIVVKASGFLFFGVLLALPIYFPEGNLNTKLEVLAKIGMICAVLLGFKYLKTTLGNLVMGYRAGLRRREIYK